MAFNQRSSVSEVIVEVEEEPQVRSASFSSDAFQTIRRAVDKLTWVSAFCLSPGP